MDVDAINSLASGTGKGNGSSSPRSGCFKCGGYHFQTPMLTSAHAKAMARKANCASHSPRVLTNHAVRKVRETENPNGNPKVPRVPKVRTRVNIRKLGFQVWKIRNQRQVQKHRNLHRRIPLTILTLMMG